MATPNTRILIADLTEEELEKNLSTFFEIYQSIGLRCDKDPLWGTSIRSVKEDLMDRGEFEFRPLVCMDSGKLFVESRYFEGNRYLHTHITIDSRFRDLHTCDTKTARAKYDQVVRERFL